MATTAISLFGTEHDSSPRNRNLVEFRAGRMFMEGTTVRPDSQKGLVYMLTGEDGLLHLYWKNRSNGHVDEDLIVFPEEAIFRRISQCTTGRVYVLQFHSSSRKLFFWLQEPKSDKDDYYCRRVNELISNPEAATQQTSVGALETMTPSAGSNNMMSFTEEQLMQYLLNQTPSGRFGGGDAQSVMDASTIATADTSSETSSLLGATPNRLPSPTRASGVQQNVPISSLSSSDLVTPVINAPKKEFSASELQTVISNIQHSTNDESLLRILTPENLAPILSNPEICARFFSMLPEGAPHSRQEIEDVIRSPQFIQQLRQLDEGLRSDQFTTICSYFGFSPDEIEGQHGVSALLAAIQKKYHQKRSQQRPPQDHMDTN